MKYYYRLLAAFLGVVFFVSFTWSQSGYLADLGIETHFLITSNEKVINDTKQLFIKRSVRFVDYYSPQDGAGVGLGGNQSYHLEFFGEKNGIKKIDITRFTPSHYILKLYKEDSLLSSIKISYKCVRKIKTDLDNVKYTYSIDLKDIPILILKEADQIDLLYYGS